MKILLVDNRSTRSSADGAAIYVAQLGPALAEEHRVDILTVEGQLPQVVGCLSRLRRAVSHDRPDVVHLNNLSGLTLLSVLWAIPKETAVAMSLHDYRLLERGRQLNLSITGRIGLVVSPSHYALDAHTRSGFFPHAIKIILPYGLDAPVGDRFPSPGGEGPGGRPLEPLILRSPWPAPFSVAIQEAFGSGRIVIAPRVGGIPEMVHDGVNGLLVEPGDEAAIASAIDRVRRSPELAARLRASALETARLYDMRYHVDRLLDAYREVLTASRTGDLDRAA